jgi:enoyl-CoA hydratase/carnithine racemase
MLHDLIELKQHKNNVYEIVLNNPQNKNALSEAMMLELIHAFNSLLSTARVVILSSTGNVFSSGHNLREIYNKQKVNDLSSCELLKLFQTCSQLMLLIKSLPFPVIAKVNGIATAAGCQLVATCDLAYASVTSQFCTPGVNLGGFCTTPSVAIGRQMGEKAAIEMLLTGEMFTAQWAFQQGLINQALPEDELDQFVETQAQKIALKSIEAVAIGKPAFYKHMQMELSAAYDYATPVMVAGMNAPAAKAGIEAFINKKRG